MKKKIIATIILTSTLLVGCGNRKILNSEWTYTKATIILGDEIINVDIETWKKYEDTIQIKDKNGKSYLTSTKNVLMTTE